MLKKDITIGNLIGILILLVGGIVTLYVRVAITEEKNKKQDIEIEGNSMEISKVEDKREQDRKDTQEKLNRIIDLQLDRK